MRTLQINKRMTMYSSDNSRDILIVLTWMPLMWSFASDGHYQDLFAWFRKRRNHQKYFFMKLWYTIAIETFSILSFFFNNFAIQDQFHKNLYKDVFLLGKRCGTTFLPVSTNLLETQPFWDFGYQTFRRQNLNITGYLNSKSSFWSLMCRMKSLLQILEKLV